MKFYDRRLGAALLCCLWFSNQANAAINGVLANNTEAERAKEVQLKRVLRRYDLARFALTHKVLIDERADVSSSHPVLTLTIGSAVRDCAFLSQYVHEQRHWFAASKQDEVGAAFELLRQRYPSASALGAQNEDAAYLHLIVSTLEFDAMIELVGEQYARKVLANSGKGVYQWVYETVLKDAEPLRALLQ